MSDNNEGNRPEQRSGVNMLIVGVHLDATLAEWRSLERQAIVLHLLFPYYPPVSLSISVLPHPLLSALILLHALCYILCDTSVPHSSSPVAHPITTSHPPSDSPKSLPSKIWDTFVFLRQAPRVGLWCVKCWCVGFWVIITSLGFQENSKLMFNFPPYSKEAPSLLLLWQLAAA